MNTSSVLKTRVLVVEDQPDIAELVRVNLHYGGFEVVLAENGAAAQKALDDILPNVILLDWMLPGQSGPELVRKWRTAERTRGIPILMLTARSDEADKIAGLDSGVDDYITKPFSTQELMARIRAVLRRHAPEQLADSVTIGELTLDAARHRVTWHGDDIPLGPTEFRLLRYFMKHPGRVHSRAVLLNKVWGDHVFIEERTVDVHIKRLREALGEAGSMIETIRGVGYRLACR